MFSFPALSDIGLFATIMSMRRGIAKIKGLGFVIWHARHEFYHILLGLMWAWFLRERWNEFNFRWVWLSVLGSLLPDADHLLYFVSHGKKDPYTKQIVQFLKKRQWRAMTVFMENGHKYNTSLTYHNYYFMIFLLTLAIVSSFYDWNAGVVLFGAMLTHYLFDIADDLLVLGYINPNWKRWGKGQGETDMSKITKP